MNDEMVGVGRDADGFIRMRPPQSKLAPYYWVPAALVALLLIVAITLSGPDSASVLAAVIAIVVLGVGTVVLHWLVTRAWVEFDESKVTILSGLHLRPQTFEFGDIQRVSHRRYNTGHFYKVKLCRPPGRRHRSVLIPQWWVGTEFARRLAAVPTAELDPWVADQVDPWRPPSSADGPVGTTATRSSRASENTST